MKRSIDHPDTVKLNVVALKAVGLACIIVALLTALVLHPPVTSADYAGWVQAFGSIGAILFAVSIASSQRRDADRRELLLRSGRLAAVRGMTEHAVEVVNGATIALLDRNLAENYVASHDAELFDEAFRMLQQIPMLELGTVGAVEGVTLIKNGVNAMKANLAMLRQNPLPIRQDHVQVAQRASQIQFQVEAGRRKVSAEIVRLLNEFSPMPKADRG
ncbi:hypothetical protein ACV229_26595 [Burkholderia sp. MR1-5-21]